jgi:hypothetical protein
MSGRQAALEPLTEDERMRQARLRIHATPLRLRCFVVNISVSTLSHRSITLLIFHPLLTREDTDNHLGVRAVHASRIRQVHSGNWP